MRHHVTVKSQGVEDREPLWQDEGGKILDCEG